MQVPSIKGQSIPLDKVGFFSKTTDLEQREFLNCQENALAASKSSLVTIVFAEHKNSHFWVQSAGLQSLVIALHLYSDLLKRIVKCLLYFVG